MMTDRELERPVRSYCCFVAFQKHSSSLLAIEAGLVEAAGGGKPCAGTTFRIVRHTAVRACAAPAFPSRTAPAQRYRRFSSKTVTACFASKGVVHPESSCWAVTPPKARPSRTERTSYRAFGGAITRTVACRASSILRNNTTMPSEVRLKRANPSQGPVPGCCHVPNGKKESESDARSRNWRNHR